MADAQASTHRGDGTPFSLLLLGDTMLGRLVDERLAVLRASGESPEHVWGDTLPLVRSADVRILNLECALTDYPVPWTRTPKVFHFRGAPRHGLPVLQAAGVQAVSLANNHVLDFNEPGMLQTFDTLDGAGIARAGAGRSLAEARAAGWVSVPVGGGARQLRVALLSASDHPEEWAAGAGTPGINLFSPFPSAEALIWARDAAAAARSNGADLVVLAMHYGGNWVLRPPESVRAFARALAEASDVDVFFGHSAHVAQGIEICEGKLIVYQAGDFLDDYATDAAWHNDWGCAFTAHYRLPTESGAPSTPGAPKPRARLERVQLTPLQLSFAETHVAPPGGRTTRAMAARLQKLSEELGTTFAVRADGTLHWPA